MQMRFAVTFLAFAIAGTLLAHPPVGVVIDSKGNVFYSDLEQVWRIDPEGNRSVAVRKVQTHELALDAGDNLYGEGVVYRRESRSYRTYAWKRTPGGLVTKVVHPREGPLRHYSFVRDPNGTMYWAERGRLGIIRQRLATGPESMMTSGIRNVRWMHATPGGTLYLVSGSDLLRIRNGQKEVFAPGLGRSLMGIWSDARENIYVADFGRGEVVRVAQDGEVRTVYRSESRWSPTGGAFDHNGDLWVLEMSNRDEVRVERVRLER